MGCCKNVFIGSKATFLEAGAEVGVEYFLPGANKYLMRAGTPLYGTGTRYWHTFLIQ